MNLLPHLRHTDSGNFFLIAGPCAIEGEQMAIGIARQISALCDKLEIPYIFKGSYRKANRTRLDSFTGIGDEKALRILRHIRDELSIPVLTDIHSVREARLAAPFVDILQIPAFLCRQTDILVAAAQTERIVNIKKGQFMSPAAMRFAVDKVLLSGGKAAWITERGTTFGYNDLVVDFRAIPQMKAFGQPVIMDCTHALQQPNQNSGVTGGRPELIETLAKAAVAVGADGLFIETHPKPSEALSDGANMLPLNKLEELLTKLVKLRKAVL